MSLLDAQKRRLEEEIVAAKIQISQMNLPVHSEHPAVHELQELIARNKQLIDMINQHVGAPAQVATTGFKRAL